MLASNNMLRIKRLKSLLFGNEDKDFLEQFKGDWNRVCNFYIAHIQKNEPVPGESFMREKIKLLEKYGRFYELYLKYKFLPDVKFLNNLDKPFWETLQKMHDFLAENPFPQNEVLNKDASYNVRYRGILLIEYLKYLVNSRFRYLSLTVFKLALYLLPFFGFIALVRQIIKF